MQPRTILAWHFIGAVLAIPAGCSKSTSPIVPVKGVLTFQGKPIPQVYLRFEPDDLATKATSMAVTDAQGRFELFLGSTPGVYRGKVKVYCDDPLAAMGARTKVPAEIEAAYRALCAKYGNGKSTYELSIDKPNSNLKLALD